MAGCSSSIVTLSNMRRRDIRIEEIVAAAFETTESPRFPETCGRRRRGNSRAAVTGLRGAATHRHRRRRDRRSPRRADASRCRSLQHGLRGIGARRWPDALGHHVVAEQPGQRTLRRAHRHRAQDDSRPGEAVQDRRGRSARRAAAALHRHQLLLRSVLFDGRRASPILAPSTVPSRPTPRRPAIPRSTPASRQPDTCSIK